VSWETIPVLKEALTLGQSALNIWVFIHEITDEFILGLDILQTQDWLVDVGCHVAMETWSMPTIILACSCQQRDDFG
jgi:hypothetical protein